MHTTPLYIVVCPPFRENKNRFFLAYLHLLVHFGVFDTIELHFGLKGHTHDGETHQVVCVRGVVCYVLEFRAPPCVV